jgi:cysteine desulfurase
MARNALDNARKKVADILSAMPDEIIFTSSGTESNNLAILGIVSAVKCQMSNVKCHIVTTNIEHSSVLETCKYLERTGQAEVTYVPVEPNGIVDPEKIKKALKENTVLVSVMYANNEIGAIQPITDIAKVIRHYRKQKSTKGSTKYEKLRKYENTKLEIENWKLEIHEKIPFFHVDAVQAANYLPINVPRLGVDLMTLNGSKIYGPKGVGLLYRRISNFPACAEASAGRQFPISKQIPNSKFQILNPIMYGGEQEFGLRPGTENVAAIVGFAKALEITEKIKDKESKRLIELRDYFIKKLKKHFSQITINGDLISRLPNNINISVPNFDSELLVLELDGKGVAVSSKSACKTESKEFYVIKAIKPDFDYKKEAIIRFSLGRQNTKKDIDLVIKSLSQIFKKYK